MATTLHRIATGLTLSLTVAANGIRVDVCTRKTSHRWTSDEAQHCLIHSESRKGSTGAIIHEMIFVNETLSLPKDDYIQMDSGTLMLNL